MSIQNILNQFLGGHSAVTPSSRAANGRSSNAQGVFSSLTDKLPGGLLGGAAAGGVMALLVGSKSARKFAGKAATYGGAAVLGGLAFNAYQNWQRSQSQTQPSSTTQTHLVNNPTVSEASFQSADLLSDSFQLTLVKAMISAAKADGHIDQQEQQRIIQALEQMQVSTELKALIFDVMANPPTATQLAAEVVSMEQKAELYLASCLAIDIDTPAEQAYLDGLAYALGLPNELSRQLQAQAQNALAAAA